MSAMARLWKSQDVLFAGIGTCRTEDHLSPSAPLALSSNSQHKHSSRDLSDASCSSPSPSLFTNPTSVTLPHIKPTPQGESPSIFSIKFPLSEADLAAYQDACVRGCPPPNLQGKPFNSSSSSLSTGPSCNNSSNHSVSSPKSRFNSSSESATEAHKSLVRVSTLLNPLRASTGSAKLSPPTLTQRRTRSHFYGCGETPIVTLNPDLEDDDVSSDEEITLNDGSLYFSSHSTPPSDIHYLPSTSNSYLSHDQESYLAPSQLQKKLASPVMPNHNLKADPQHSLLVSPSSTTTTTYTVSTRTIDSQMDAPLSTDTSSKMATTLPFWACTDSDDLPQSPPTRNYNPLLERCLSNGPPKSYFSPEAQPFVLESEEQSDDCSSYFPSRKKADSISGPSTISPLDPRDVEWSILESAEERKSDGGDRTFHIAKSAKNKSKNRYQCVLALDSTRVKLNPSPGAVSDYINANHVIGAYDDGPSYISTQAPVPASFDDFWRMIWEQNVEIVVMLTRLIESGKPKAHKYWPTSKPRWFGKIKVTFLSVQNSDYDYKIKEFELECNGEKRKVLQYHYLGWPDHSVPASPDSLLHMISSIDAYIDDRKKMAIKQNQNGDNSNVEVTKTAGADAALVSAVRAIPGSTSKNDDFLRTSDSASMGDSSMSSVSISGVESDSSVSPLSSRNSFDGSYPHLQFDHHSIFLSTLSNALNGVNLTPPSSTRTSSPEAPTPHVSPGSGPILVHCSAGIGRSGAFILIHSALKRLAAEGKTSNDLDMKELVYAIRAQRDGAITHQAQYNFCCDVIDIGLAAKKALESLHSIAKPTPVAKLKTQHTKSLKKSSSDIPSDGVACFDDS